MDKNRIWLIGSVIVMVAVLAMGVLFGVQPQLSAIATANQARVAVEATNNGQAAVLAKLKSDFAGIEALKSELVPLTASVPSGTQMSSFVTQLDTLAKSTAVTFTAMTVADAVPYAPPAPLAQTGTAGAVIAPPLVTSAQITAASFASLAVTITVTGSYAHALDFVSGLQSGQRLYLVTGLTTALADAATGSDTATAPTGNVTATITGLVYVLVPPASATATPATPAK